MNCASARCRRAMPPFMTAKREPVSLAAVSKSSPRGAPTSTWSLTSKSKTGSVPTFLTSILPDSSAPTGTDACGRLGTASRKALIAACTTSSRAAEAVNCSPMVAVSASTAEASSPLPFNMPICLDRLLRRPCSSSVCVWICLRSASSALKPGTSSWNLRAASRSATAAMSLRRS